MLLTHSNLLRVATLSLTPWDSQYSTLSLSLSLQAMVLCFLGDIKNCMILCTKSASELWSSRVEHVKTGLRVYGYTGSKIKSKSMLKSGCRMPAGSRPDVLRILLELSSEDSPGINCS